MPIVLMFLGIYYAVKRPQIARATPSDCPGVPPEQVEEWQRCELRSIDIFLLSTWGNAVAGFVLSLLLLRGGAQPGGVVEANQSVGTGIAVVQIVLFLAGLITSAVYGSRAAKLRGEFGKIGWDKNLPDGASFLGPAPSSFWVAAAPILGAGALVPGVGSLFCLPALVTGALALRDWKRDPQSGRRGRVTFALWAGGGSLAIHAVLTALMHR